MTTSVSEESRPRRRWIWAAIVVVLGCGLWIGAEALPTEGNWRPVERRDLVLGVPIEGELRAVESTTLSPPSIEQVWQFKISSLTTEGTEVEEGDPVVSFDTTELRQRLLAKIAERDQAEKELEKKITDLQIERRDKELSLAEAKARLRKALFLLEVPDEVVSRNELEEARIDERLAKLEIEFLEGNLEYLDVREELEVGTLRSKRDLAASQVESLEQAMEEMTLRAPRSGTLLYLGDWQGEKPKIGDQVWRMRTLAEIPDLSAMEAEGEVAEGDAGRLATGQRVSFRLDAYPDREYHGEIVQIRRAVQRKSRSNPTKVVKVLLRIEESDPERMRPGMRLRGQVEIRRLENVLAVPEDAVQAGPDGAWVQVRGAFGTSTVYPTLGERDDRYFEVEDGLDEGAVVRVAGGASQ